MTEHAWQRVGGGTAHYCAQCHMRVDDDEFNDAVESSLCVPQELIEQAAEVLEDHSDGTLEKPVTLAQFARFCGFDLSPWQMQMLEVFDAEIRKRHGL